MTATIHQLFALVEPPGPLTIPPVPGRTRFHPSCIPALQRDGWLVCGPIATRRFSDSHVTIYAEGSWSVEIGQTVIEGRAADPVAAATAACSFAMRLVPATRRTWGTRGVEHGRR